MDAIDQQLIIALQENARITIKELSLRLNLSRPSVTERMHKLEDRGVIQGYTARIDPQALGKQVFVIIEARQMKVACHKFEEKIREMDAITECHRVTGVASFFIKALVENITELEALVDELIPYASLNTSVVLSSPVSFRPLGQEAQMPTAVKDPT